MVVYLQKHWLCPTMSREGQSETVFPVHWFILAADHNINIDPHIDVCTLQHDDNLMLMWSRPSFCSSQLTAFLTLQQITSQDSFNDLPALFMEVLCSWSYRNLHFFNAGVNVKDCVVTWTDDGFVFNDDDLRKGITKVMRREIPRQKIDQWHHAIQMTKGRVAVEEENIKYLNNSRINELKAT